MKIYKRGHRWYVDATVNGVRYREALDTTDKRQAVPLAQKRIAEIQQGKGASKMGREFARLSFGEAAEVFLEETKMHVAPRTHQLYRERLRPLRTFFGDKPMMRISASEIAAYQRARTSGTLGVGDLRRRKRQAAVGNRSVNMEVTVLRLMMRRAKVWNIMAEDVRMLPERGKPVAKVLTEEQKAILFATAAERPGYMVVHCAATLAASTTCRGVELKHIRWSDVDLFEKTLTVRRSKTEAGHRIVPLTGDAMAALARLRERAELNRAAEPEHYVFPACEGLKIDPARPQKSWRTAWRSLTKEAGRIAGQSAAREAIRAGRGWKAGLQAWRKAAEAFRGFRFHDLRHQAITELAESGASDATLMAMAGHMSRRMMEHYSHVRMEAKRAAVAALDRGGRLMGKRASLEDLKPEGGVS